MRIVNAVFMILCLCGVAGCASRGDLQNLEQDTTDARKRIVRLEREMEGVRKAANDEVQNSLKGFKKDIETVRKSTADLQASQDTIRVDMREMLGKVDDLKILVQKRTDDRAFQKEETDRRLAAIEDRLAKLEKQLGEGALPGSGASAATPESIYQSGLDAFKGGDMQKARDEFSRVIEINPQHDLAANAHYWIGETFYSEKKYDQAILAFQEVIKKFPKKEKAAASLLKQAMSFKGLGDVKSARYVLKKLQQDYPRTDEAKKAKVLIKELK